MTHEKDRLSGPRPGPVPVPGAHERLRRSGSGERLQLVRLHGRNRVRDFRTGNGHSREQNVLHHQRGHDGAGARQPRRL